MRATGSVLGICGVLLSAAGASAQSLDFSKPLKTPYASSEVLAVRGVTFVSEAVPRFGQVEMTVDLSATYDNPFDAGDMTLDARILTPSKKKVDVPGYYHQAFARELVGGKEVLTSIGKPTWRLRYSPKEIGVHNVTIRVHDRTGAAVLPNRRFTVTPSKLPGMVRVSPRDPRYFEFENGKSFFPIGPNVCWPGARGTFDYDRWLPAYARAGCNYGRVSLSPPNHALALQRPGKPADGLGMGLIDLGNAWRFEQILRTAQSSGLRLMLSIDSHSTLTERGPVAPGWAEAPYNSKNGGPLRRPADFWTDETTEGLYLNKLRYVVARFGSSPAVMSWELWDEVDLTENYNSAPVSAWHTKITDLIRKLDPHQHPMSTSFSRLEGDPAIDHLPALDFVQTHNYGGPDPSFSLATAQQLKARYKKPHLITEVGADWHGAKKELDPQGLQIRLPLWASVAIGASGGAMPWGWDTYIEPQQLHGAFTAASKFVTGIDWPAEKLRAVKPRVDWVKRPRNENRPPISVPGGPITWAASMFNRPRTVSVTRSGISGDTPVAGIQHGIQAQPELHNPITFQVNLPWSSRLVIAVSDVSGNGGGVLKATLDAKSVLEFDFADVDTGKQPLRQYAGSYQVQIPPGKHTVVVENVGRDWFLANYRFVDAVEPTGPALDARGSVGRSTVIAWVRNANYTWQQVGVLKETPKPVPASVLVIPGVTPGKWQADLWDTWSGKVVGTQAVTVSTAGEARVSLPTITKDLGVRMRRATPAPKR